MRGGPRVNAGGPRPNSGRPLGGKNRLPHLDKVSKKVLEQIDTVALWKKILHSNSPKTALAALMYLFDRVYGRPAQTIQGGAQPLKIEFSWGSTPDWMKPVNKAEPVIREIAAKVLDDDD